MKKLKLIWAQFLLWFDMKILALLGYIINRRINAYLPDLNLKVEELVHWEVRISGMKIGFSAKVPKSYQEMGAVLTSVGMGLQRLELVKENKLEV